MPRQNADYGEYDYGDAGDAGRDDTGTQREPGDEDGDAGTIPMNQGGSDRGGDPDGLAGLEGSLKACKSIGAVLAVKQNWPTAGLSQRQLMQLDAECAARTSELKAQKNSTSR